MRKAIILFSGGLDSTTCLAMAKAQGYECYALSVEYGQKHNVELTYAMKLAKSMGALEHKIVSLQLDGSSLTDAGDSVENFKNDNKIPTTYVPARNTIFLSLALGWAEVLGAFDIFIGANIMDYSGYPDCRPEFLQAFENVANLGTKAGVEGTKFHIHSPLLQMTKAEIIKEGIKLGIDYGATISCYRADAEGRACGNCDSCTYRKKGFKEAGLPDPTHYL